MSTLDLSATEGESIRNDYLALDNKIASLRHVNFLCPPIVCDVSVGPNDITLHWSEYVSEHIEVQGDSVMKLIEARTPKEKLLTIPLKSPYFISGKPHHALCAEFPTIDKGSAIIHVSERYLKANYPSLQGHLVNNQRIEILLRLLTSMTSCKHVDRGKGDGFKKYSEAKLEYIDKLKCRILPSVTNTQSGLVGTELFKIARPYDFEQDMIGQLFPRKHDLLYVNDGTGVVYFKYADVRSFDVQNGEFKFAFCMANGDKLTFGFSHVNVHEFEPTINFFEQTAIDVGHVENMYESHGSDFPLEDINSCDSATTVIASNTSAVWDSSTISDAPAPDEQSTTSLSLLDIQCADEDTFEGYKYYAVRINPICHKDLIGPNDENLKKMCKQFGVIIIYPLPGAADPFRIVIKTNDPSSVKDCIASLEKQAKHILAIIGQNIEFAKVTEAKTRKREMFHKAMPAGDDTDIDSDRIWVPRRYQPMILGIRGNRDPKIVKINARYNVHITGPTAEEIATGDVDHVYVRGNDKNIALTKTHYHNQCEKWAEMGRIPMNLHPSVLYRVIGATPAARAKRAEKHGVEYVEVNATEDGCVIYGELMKATLCGAHFAAENTKFYDSQQRTLAKKNKSRPSKTITAIKKSMAKSVTQSKNSASQPSTNVFNESLSSGQGTPVVRKAKATVNETRPSARGSTRPSTNVCNESASTGQGTSVTRESKATANKTRQSARGSTRPSTNVFNLSASSGQVTPVVRKSKPNQPAATAAKRRQPNGKTLSKQPDTSTPARVESDDDFSFVFSDVNTATANDSSVRRGSRIPKEPTTKRRASPVMDGNRSAKRRKLEESRKPEPKLPIAPRTESKDDDDESMNGFEGSTGGDDDDDDDGDDNGVPPPSVKEKSNKPVRRNVPVPGTNARATGGQPNLRFQASSSDDGDDEGEVPLTVAPAKTKSRFAKPQRETKLVRNARKKAKAALLECMSPTKDTTKVGSLGPHELLAYAIAKRDRLNDVVDVVHAPNENDTSSSDEEPEPPKPTKKSNKSQKKEREPELKPVTKKVVSQARINKIQGPNLRPIVDAWIGRGFSLATKFRNLHDDMKDALYRRSAAKVRTHLTVKSRTLRDRTAAWYASIRDKHFETPESKKAKQDAQVECHRRQRKKKKKLARLGLDSDDDCSMSEDKEKKPDGRLNSSRQNSSAAHGKDVDEEKPNFFDEADESLPAVFPVESSSSDDSDEEESTKPSPRRTTRKRNAVVKVVRDKSHSSDSSDMTGDSMDRIEKRATKVRKQVRQKKAATKASKLEMAAKSVKETPNGTNAAEKAESAKAAAEKAESEKAAAKKAKSEKAAEKQAKSAMAAAKKAETQKAAAEKAEFEKAAAKLAKSAKAAEEKAESEKAAAKLAKSAKAAEEKAKSDKDKSHGKEAAEAVAPAEVRMPRLVEYSFEDGGDGAEDDKEDDDELTASTQEYLQDSITQESDDSEIVE